MLSWLRYPRLAPEAGGHGQSTHVLGSHDPRRDATVPQGFPTSRSSLATSLSSCKMPSSCPITIFIRLRILSLSQLLLLLLQLLLLLLGWSLGCLSWQVWESILPYQPWFPAPTALSILLPPSRVAWRPCSPSRLGSSQHLNVPLPPRKSQPHARLPARSGGSGSKRGAGSGCSMRSRERCKGGSASGHGEMQGGHGASGRGECCLVR